ncbi:MAG TPA: SHOCT domain-containing protein [Micropepsaceae bacterium]|nr:SHOCT domain-containing protein [Micropepsaceae bacterium]
MMWWYGGPGFGAFGHGWWAGHIIGFVLVWVFLNVLAVMALQRLVRPRPSENEHASDRHDVPPVIILQERYVRGEIGREEFIQKQRDLSAAG